MCMLASPRRALCSDNASTWTSDFWAEPNELACVDFWLCYGNKIRQTEPPNIILVLYEDIPCTQAGRLLPYEKTRSSRKSLKGRHSRKSTQLKARVLTETSAAAGPQGRQERNNHSTKKDKLIADSISVGRASKILFVRNKQ